MDWWINPSEKYESHLGWLFPIEWKKKHHHFLINHHRIPSNQAKIPFKIPWNHHFPMVFLWKTIIFPWFSHGFPMANRVRPCPRCANASPRWATAKSSCRRCWDGSRCASGAWNVGKIHGKKDRKWRFMVIYRWFIDDTSGFQSTGWWFGTWKS